MTKETKHVYLCSNCKSDDVQEKYWANPNTKEVDWTYLDEDEGYCMSCEQHGELNPVEMKETAQLIGFQVVGEEGTVNEGHIHPMMAGSFCLYSVSQCREMIDNSDCSDIDEQSSPYNEWRMIAIWTGDVEKPTLMFKGDPRK